MAVYPSPKLLVLIEQVHGNVNAAAVAWGVHPRVLYRFLKGKGGLSLDTAAQIAARTSLSLNELFEIRVRRKRSGLRNRPSALAA